MKTLTRCCILGSLLITTPLIFAQAKSAAPAPGSAAGASTPGTAAAPAPKGPSAKSHAEAVALVNLNKLAATPATTGAQLDAAINDFVTRYPKSDFLATAYVFGLEYYSTPAHKDYAKSLNYGEEAIKADPKELYALVTVAGLIPDNATSTDLDFNQEIAEATTDANKALAVAADDAAAGIVNGKPFTAATEHAVQGMAYAALAKIAMDKKDYAGAVVQYKKAATVDDPTHAAADYFYAARAQMQMQHWSDALASLNQAETIAPNLDPRVKAVIDANIKLVKKNMAGGN